MTKTSDLCSAMCIADECDACSLFTVIGALIAVDVGLDASITVIAIPRCGELSDLPPKPDVRSFGPVKIQALRKTTDVQECQEWVYSIQRGVLWRAPDRREGASHVNPCIKGRKGGEISSCRGPFGSSR